MTVVALVDDHLLFRAALALALRTRGLQVIEPPLTSLVDVQQRLVHERADVVLLDRDLGQLGSGEPLIGPLVAHGVSVLVVSGSLDDMTMGRCLASGAAACIPKAERLETVLEAVVKVAAGEVVTAPAERDRVIACWRSESAVSDAASALFDRLTPREAFVLIRLMDGRTVSSIADKEFVSKATVRAQVRSILQKLGVNSQLEAVALARRSGWSGSLPSGSLQEAP